jgi:small subunit ribosomal protein S20
MPITKSAKKALRQSQKRKKQNLVWKTKIKKLEKEIKKLTEEKKIKEVKKILPQFYKTVDKAVKNNVLKKNTASRKKSKMAKVI